MRKAIIYSMIYILHGNNSIFLQVCRRYIADIIIRKLCINIRINYPEKLGNYPVQEKRIPVGSKIILFPCGIIAMSDIIIYIEIPADANHLSQDKKCGFFLFSVVYLSPSGQKERMVHCGRWFHPQV